MNRSALTAVSMFMLTACTQLEHPRSMTESTPVQPDPTRISAVSPALERYTNQMLLEEQWSRPELSARDRSIVTLSTLIARNQPAELPFYVRRALDSGVTATEISETVTHLAFYAGWGNAMAAVAVIAPVFKERGIDEKALPTARVTHLPIDEVTERARATGVSRNFGDVAPGVVQNTTDLLFRDLWLRPGLAPRDRSLVTVSALIASGQLAQIPYHLNRAMDNGLTQPEASEVLTHIAFYAGWPNVFSAMPVAKDVFSKR
ncbi:carboxymuconolactone decarboxylase family protein [Pseudomonas matsuisoli]|uniref:4-carboxymuconolactone decarboxylase n=1 Tax=Pseudomonas matsuisoli TaxID=1515666 RepID=A0A917Q1X6_9PSED|nr:carboxymuconolactone decarboxylase family protein [Pseudomonas matsuisoli]GGK06422.1 4-carboxymuconolactone decarboxylase [Pseudomonas matsuisoli]